MNKINIYDQLIGLIDQVLRGDIGVEKFEEDYYSVQGYDPELEFISDEAENFFGWILGLLSLTGPSPTEEERQWGCMDHEEFLKKLRELRNDFEKYGKVDDDP